MSLREIALLLETGNEEFKKGNSLRGLSILFEAQCLLSEVVQRQAEMMRGLEMPSGSGLSRCL